MLVYWFYPMRTALAQRPSGPPEKGESMSGSYADLAASDAAAKMLDASLAGDNAEQISEILESVVTANARTIGEAHVIRNRALAILGWAR